ncbi:glycosyl transferase, partial [Amycolatopsis sp. H20-H5]|nr:glycosyl transferase [Amycolatopsis sp. H20-H5]
WQGRATLSARLVRASMIAATAVWDFILLDRTSTWLPVLRWVIVVLGVVVATAVVMGVHQLRKAVLVTGVATVLTLGLGSAAYAVDTASLAHSGSIPTSGPVSDAMGGVIFPGQDSASTAVGDLLARTTTKWAAATTGSQSAASLELASGKSVIGIGGWSGTDPAPTLAEFQQYVANGDVKYFVDGGRGGGRGGGSSEITTWVTATFTATTVDGQTVYDLTT